MAISLLDRTDKQSDEHDKGSGASRVMSLERVVPVATLLLAFALRLYHLGVDSLWYDETYSVYVSGLDLARLTQHTAGDIHPPLYYYALHFWMEVTGKGEFALGFLSLLFGVLLIALVYRLALGLFDRPVAMVSALLVAASPFHLWYSQEVRMYTMATLLTLLSLWFALKLLSDEASGRKQVWYLAGYAVSSALGLYVLYYVAFALISLNLYVAARCLLTSRLRADRALLGRWLLAQVGAIALYLPWLPSAGRQVLSPAVPPWRHFVDIAEVLSESWSALSLGQSSDPAEMWPFLLLFAALYVLGLIAALKWRAGHLSLLLATTVWGPIVLIFLVSLVTPLFFVRYVFTYSPLFYVTLALGIVFVWRHVRALGLLNILVALGVFATSAQAYFQSDAYAPDDFRSAVRYIESGWGPGDVVLLDAGYIYPAFLYYFGDDVAWRGRLTDYQKAAKIDGNGPIILQLGSIGGSSNLGWGDSKADFYPTTKEEVARSLETVASSHARLWLLRCYDTVTDPEGFVRDWLADNATLTDEIVVQGSSNMRVQRYLLSEGRGTKPSAPPLVNFDNSIAISSFSASSSAIKSGEDVFLQFAWLRQTGFGKDVRAYVALTDDRGRVWQQQDAIPVGRLYPSSNWLAASVLADTWQFRIPVGTPPGTYKLVAGVYVAASGQALEVRGAGGKPLGPQAVLGRVTVEANPGIVPPAQMAETKMDFGGGLGLVDYKLGSHRVKPGDPLHIDLFWKALSAPQGDYAPVLLLEDGKGQGVSRLEAPPVEGGYPTSLWQRGEIVRDQRNLVVDAGVPDGDYGLHLRLGSKDLTLGEVKVRGRPHSYEVPKDIANPLRIGLGDGVELLGFDLEPRGGSSSTLAETSAGQALQLTLYWRATKRMETSYTVFTQLLDDANRIQGQRDRPPGDGTLPTSSWLPGEVIVDSYQVQVKPDASPGELRLIAGMYDPETGQRLPIADSGGKPIGDAYVLGKVAVKP